jgi:hypothetical protein
MKVQIISKPVFSVIGIEGSGKADKGPSWIGPLWEQAHKRRAEIEHLLKPTGEAWGLMSATDEYLAAWKEEGKYLARALSRSLRTIQLDTFLEAVHFCIRLTRVLGVFWLRVLLRTLPIPRLLFRR